MAHPTHHTAPTAPAARRDVLSTVLDDEQILFDPISARAHRLNATAAAVWSRLDGRCDVATLADDVASAFTADPVTVAAAVDDLLAALRAEGLLADGTPTPVRTPRPTGWLGAVPLDVAPLPLGAPHRCRPVRVLTAELHLATNDPAARDAIDALLAPLAVAPASTGTDLELVGDGSAVELRRDGVVLRRTRSWAEALRQLVAGCNHLASYPDAPMLTLHAAGAVVDGRAVVLPAAPESGKSTLVTALVRAGATYLGDEVVGIGDDLRLVPYPKPIALDPGSWSLFEDLRPRRGSLAAFLDDDRQWLVDPGAVGPGRTAHPDERPRLGAVVLPRYEAGGGTHLRRLPPAEAAMALLAETFDLGAVGAPGLDLVATVCEAVPVHRLVLDRLDDAVEAIRAVARDVT